MIRSLTVSLSLTLLIELIISVMLGIRNRNDIKTIICANVITNPAIVYIVNCISLITDEMLYFFVLVFLECIAFIIEALIYEKHLIFNKISPINVSLINNTFSFVIGVIINIIE